MQGAWLVSKQDDESLLDFIERRGIQIWSIRKSKHGPVTHFWVQNPSPFVQTYDVTVRGALRKLKNALEKSGL
jgi:hypothetical protein